MEYRRKCNVCGKIYCYTDEDLKKNSSNSAMAAISAVGTIAAVLGGGTRLDAYALDNRGDRYSERVVDYSKCPSCHSKDTSLLSDKEWESVNKGESNGLISQSAITINSNASVDSLLKRVQMFLEDKDWNSAMAYCEQILDVEPECAQAYVYKLMVELKVDVQEKLSDQKEPFDADKTYIKAFKFADADLKEKLKGYNETIVARNIENEYKGAVKKLESAATTDACEKLIPVFSKLGDYKDSKERVQECEQRILEISYECAHELKTKAKTKEDFLKAKSAFDEIGDYKDSSDMSAECGLQAQESENNAVYDEAIDLFNSDSIDKVNDAVKKFESIAGWKESNEKKKLALKKIKELEHKKEKTKKKALIIAVALCILIAIGVFSIVTVKNNQYEKAVAEYEGGDYYSAYNIFLKIGSFKDAEEMRFNAAKALALAGEYDTVLTGLGNCPTEVRTFCELMTKDLSAMSYSDNFNEVFNTIDTITDEDLLKALNTNEIIGGILNLEGTWRLTSYDDLDPNNRYADSPFLDLDYERVLEFRHGQVKRVNGGKHEYDVYYSDGTYYIDDQISAQEYLMDYDGVGDSSFTLYYYAPLGIKEKFYYKKD